MIFNLGIHSFSPGPSTVPCCAQDNPKFFPLMEFRWEVCGDPRQISNKHFRVTSALREINRGGGAGGAEQEGAK